MAANLSEGFDDHKSIGNAPPSYEATPLSGSFSASAQSFSLSSLFSFLFINHQRTAVLSRIRDIVLTPNFTPSSAISIINACAADLTPSRFSKLLQTPNIEGHTALYWAIVNNKREVLSAFAAFISECSPACSSELRLACILASDHASFTQLKLANIDDKGEALRRSLGCPPDELEVHETGRVDGDYQFAASVRIRMFQKRLRITHKLNYEFVAGGRIWWFRFAMDNQWKWRIKFGLASPSLPACPKASFRIQDDGEPDRKSLHLTDTKFAETVVPDV
ncbi:hypothetical protein DFJ58DRAFT_749959 [Suillus subalutaceus]|uniref:uncharacterized protein n=1 Tax=Suillus subalutaceus TaxID=48586 RepID=UPI001B8684CC|nr:uncharacterized protein DFJ58DRAFT_749959 [Suillus subalutaceus]KAG1836005.1 hypothetical protein DFJ58DRAFT_749959 [Suillus subalutaceus]